MFNIQKAVDNKVLSGYSGPLVMGILNVTPDSFSDGGQFVSHSSIEAHIVQMVDSGVDIIDIGGESTKPGALPVSLQVELDRILPTIEWVADNFDITISIDTYKTGVMASAIAFGAEIINDVNALQSKGAMEVAVNTEVTVCLMHCKGSFSSMQEAPAYDDVFLEVSKFLVKRAGICSEKGIDPARIILDPGFGFGKTLAHNIWLFKKIGEFVALGYPILVGVSRKRMISEILNSTQANQSAIGSVSAAVLAGLKGASIVRVHDVKETVEALSVAFRLK